MNNEQRKLEKILQDFLNDIPIDQKTKLRNFTSFDRDVVFAIRELQRKYADIPKPFKMTKELKDLGFLDPNKSDSKGTVGCVTIPCCGGKMPYQHEPDVPCVIIRSMCNKSPVDRMCKDDS